MISILKDINFMQDGRQIMVGLSVIHRDGLRTDSFVVVTPKGSVFLVDLYSKQGQMPHGWEATKPESDNESGYFSTGGLDVEAGELTDFDGVYTLPACVAVILRACGVKVSDDCLAQPLVAA